MGRIEQNRTASAKKAVLQALKKTLGVVSPALDKAKIARSTYYKWLQEDAEFKSEVDDLQNVALDFAESQLLKSITRGSDTATIFYLKTKGKTRGFVERHDHTTNGKDINAPAPLVFVSASSLTDDQLDKYIRKDVDL